MGRYLHESFTSHMDVVAHVLKQHYKSSHGGLVGEEWKVESSIRSCVVCEWLE